MLISLFSPIYAFIEQLKTLKKFIRTQTVKATHVQEKMSPKGEKDSLKMVILTGAQLFLCKNELRKLLRLTGAEKSSKEFTGAY